LHDDPSVAVAALETIDMSDVRVAQRRKRLGLLLEARDAHRVARERGGQNLDRHVAAERRVARAVNLAHAAEAERLGDVIRAEQCSWRNRHSDPGAPRGCFFLCAGFYRTARYSR